jgi:hypothetical protein
MNSRKNSFALFLAILGIISLALSMYNYVNSERQIQDAYYTGVRWGCLQLQSEKLGDSHPSYCQSMELLERQKDSFNYVFPWNE